MDSKDQRRTVDSEDMYKIMRLVNRLMQLSEALLELIIKLNKDLYL